MTINLKSPFTWLFLAGLIVLLVIVFRNCTPKTANPDRTVIDSLVSSNENLKKQHKQDSLSYFVNIAAANKRYDSLYQRQRFAEVEIGMLQSENYDLANNVKSAKVQKDTVMYYANCDQLADSVIKEHSIAENYASLNDSLNRQHIEEMRIKDEFISGQQEQLAQKDQIMAEGLVKYNDLDKRDQKTQKKLRFNQGLGKVLAGALIVVSIIAILK